MKKYINDIKLSGIEKEILEFKIFVPHLISNNMIIQYSNKNNVKEKFSIMDIL
jgi:hypothetical protein